MTRIRWTFEASTGPHAGQRHWLADTREGIPAEALIELVDGLVYPATVLSPLGIPPRPGHPAPLLRRWDVAGRSMELLITQSCWVAVVTGEVIEDAA